MPLFRFHRGSLKDSLQTTFYVKDRSDLHEKINNFNTLTNKPRSTDDNFCISSSIRDKDDLIIEKYVFDDRIGWDTHIVLVKSQCITRDPYVIGFLSENIEVPK